MAGKYAKPRKLVQREQAAKKSGAVRGQKEKYQPKYGAGSRTAVQAEYEPKQQSAIRPQYVPDVRRVSPTRKAHAARAKRAKARRGRIVAVCILVAVALAVGVWSLVSLFFNPYNIKPIPGQDPNAINGTLVQNDRVKVEPGHYRIVINMSPKMTVGSKACNLNIENVLGNAYTVKVQITDESGGLLYSSGYIQPGQRVESVELEKELTEGDHVVTATYFLYDSKTLEESGSTGTAITITVQP